MGRDCEGSDCVSTQHVKTKKKGRRMAEKFKSHSLGWLRTCSQLSDVLTVLWPSEQQDLIDWTICFVFPSGLSVSSMGYFYWAVCCWCRGLKQTSAIYFCENGANSNEKQSTSLNGCCLLEKRVDWVWCWAKMISATLYNPAWIRWRGLFGFFSRWPLRHWQTLPFLVWT